MDKLSYEAIQQEVTRLICDIRNLETFLALPKAKEAWTDNKDKFNLLLKTSMYGPDLIDRFQARLHLRELLILKRDPNLNDLRREAATLGIFRYTRYNKPELVELIKNAKLKCKTNIQPDRQH